MIKLGLGLSTAVPGPDVGRTLLQILPVPFGARKYDVDPYADCLSRRCRQVKRPLGGLHHERAPLTFAAVRVVDVHFLDVL